MNEIKSPLVTSQITFIYIIVSHQITQYTTIFPQFHAPILYDLLGCSEKISKIISDKHP